MQYIPQIQLENLKRKLTPGKVVVLYGPRRAGKTTLLHHFLKQAENYIFVTGEDISVHDYLSSQSLPKLKEFVGNHELLVIDEAQHIDNIGINLKLLIDHIPNLQIIATGSSTFDLARNVGEPLTGRKKVLHLFPLSQMEIGEFENPAETKALLESRLIYGSYPEVVLQPSAIEKREYLLELIQDYLFKDILKHQGVAKSKKMIDLLKLLAFQIGHEVSLSELATQLGISKTTVEKYINLLEQVFILINIGGFSRNLRKEITKSSRYYFYDTGIRNALINNFNLFSSRDDIGAIWENYLVIERMKFQEYNRLPSNNYFWRTYDQKEIDWVEEREGKLFAYEFKWKKNNVKAPKLWEKTYPDSEFSLINSENYLNFIT